MNVNKRQLILASLLFIGLISIYFIIVLSFWLYSKDRAYPLTYVAGASVAGKTESEINALLVKHINNYQQEKIGIISEKPAEITPDELGATFDVGQAAREAITRGKNNPFILGVRSEISITASVDNQKLFDLINGQSGGLSTVAESPRLSLVGESLQIDSGEIGKRVNFSESAHNIISGLGNLKKEFFISSFVIGDVGSSLLNKDLESEILSRTKNGIKLVASPKEYLVEQDEILNWVNLNSGQESLAMIYGGDEILRPKVVTSDNIFSEHKIALYLSEIASGINTNPKNAELGIKDGAVIVTKSDENGQKLLVTDGSQLIAAALNTNKSIVDLPIQVLKAEIRADNLADLGLTGLISTGYSNFAGSPGNRRHNIKVGASKFNGYLIRPDETFSFIAILGPVDASTGYLPELVIKENKTIPEYGGGMCQVSSTAFRAALNGGLPITERTAHSYPVSYYKPFGVDATVYIPKPDLVFKNDTGKYILIQTRIEGNQLSFDFYGTKLARTMKFSGNENAIGASDIVEKVSPLIYDQGARGNGSFTAVFWRHIYDTGGELIGTKKFVSKYDSPDKYPH